METDYRNTMATASHIRPVGPHGHDWTVVGYDSRGDVYQECASCGTRRCRSTAPGRPPERQDWLEGAAWGVATAAAPVHTHGDLAPTAASLRRLGKQEAMAGCINLGIDIEGKNRVEMIDALLAHHGLG